MFEKHRISTYHLNTKRFPRWTVNTKSFNEKQKPILGRAVFSSRYKNRKCIFREWPSQSSRCIQTIISKERDSVSESLRHRESSVKVSIEWLVNTIRILHFLECTPFHSWWLPPIHKKPRRSSAFGRPARHHRSVTPTRAWTSVASTSKQARCCHRSRPIYCTVTTSVSGVLYQRLRTGERKTVERALCDCVFLKKCCVNETKVRVCYVWGLVPTVQRREFRPMC